MSDTEDAIRAGKEAVAATPKESPDRAALLNNLGLSLRERFLRTGAMADLEEAIQVTQQAVEATLENHPDQNTFLSNLGVQLGLKHSKTGSMADLEQAIQVTEKSIRKTSSEDPKRAGRLSNVAMLLGYKYKRTGAIDTLEEAIQLVQEAIKMTALDSPDRGLYLNNLAISLGEKYRRTGDIADLEEANRVMREAINTTPSNTGHLNNLAIQLLYKYTRTGEIVDLNEAIQAMQKAIETTPIEHTDRAMLLSNLGILLRDRFSRMGKMADLEEAIQAAREAVNATPLDHPDRAGRLDNLGMQLRHRYSRTGEIADLEGAVQAAQLAIQSIPSDHPDCAMILHNFGASLRDRYLRMGVMADLEEAIRLERDAIKLTSLEHPSYAMLLHNLGVQLGDRYSRKRGLADLEEAIKVMQDALKATLLDHLERPWLLNNLGMSLSDRYESTNAISDLEEAIRYTQEAIKEIPVDHPYRPMFLNNLAMHLGRLYSRPGTVADLEEAIRVSQEAVEATPTDHPMKALCLTTLGLRLGDRYKKTREDSDLQAAILCHQTALHQHSSSTINRIASGLELLALSANNSDWEQAYKASDTAVHLLNFLAPRDLEISDKQHMLSLIVGLACDAAAIALNAEKDPLVALELLELGRGVLAASLEEMRTDILDLKERHPLLAENFLNLRDELSEPVHRYISPTDESGISPPQAQTRRRYDTNRKLDNLILEIRKHPGFEDFLLLPSKEELQSAASYGPIIVINVSQYRCDAFLIERNRVRSLSLPKLNIKDVEEKARNFNLGSLHILEWLWDVVASPILDALGFSQPPPDDDWPHVWWIPTGALSKFPLHAAGSHSKDSKTALDRVISSYSSSVKVITHSRHRHILTSKSSSPGQALLVAMEKTPGLPKLPFATREVNMIRNLCKSMELEPVEPQRYKEDVLSYLRNCRIFHFAGHGHSNNADPSQSYIYLEDWKSDRLTVANLLEINLRGHSPFLAYLSACGTGQIKNERFMDESIHLISGFQLAGFRHVIGTLWEVNDECCLDISGITYQEMKDGGLNDASVSKGLHLATRRLRDRWFKQSTETRNRSTSESNDELKWAKKENAIMIENDGEQSKGRSPRDILPCDDDELAPIDWVQYVHFGV